MEKSLQQSAENPQLTTSPSEGFLESKLANIREMLSNLFKRPQNPDEVTGCTRRNALELLAFVGLAVTTCARPLLPKEDDNEEFLGETGLPVTTHQKTDQCYSLEAIRNNPELLKKFEDVSLPNSVYHRKGDAKGDNWIVEGTTFKEDGGFEIHVSHPTEGNPDPDEYVSFQVFPFRTEICLNNTVNFQVEVPGNPTEPGGDIRVIIVDKQTSAKSLPITLPPYNTLEITGGFPLFDN